MVHFGTTRFKKDDCLVVIGTTEGVQAWELAGAEPKRANKSIINRDRGTTIERCGTKRFEPEDCLVVVGTAKGVQVWEPAGAEPKRAIVIRGRGTTV